MITEALAKARAYEAERRSLFQQEQPAFHLTGGAGWINDPNGFAPYQGEYHLFYQYHPYGLQWGPMHWGHAKTEDFIRWEMLPAALAPEESYDKDGCFSGGALELTDGRHLLMYTGVRKELQANGRLEDRQTQCIAIGDGLNYGKYPGNPVISGSSLPEGGSLIDFRDPKIWQEGNAFRAVVVNRGPDNCGNVLLYESPDALHWQYRAALASCGGRYGKMWECPDFFHLDGKAVLIHCAQEMRPEGLEYHGGNCTVCHIGRFDDDQCRLVDEAVHAVEYGLDFYAPQTLESADGRRILIGWMQSWESSSRLPEGLHFMGQMTIPRELRIKNGRLCQLPVRELENYREAPVSYQDVTILQETQLPGISGRILDLNLSIRPLEETYGKFRIRIAKDAHHVTTITLRPDKGIIRLDRTYSGFPHDIVHVRDIPVPFRDGQLQLRLILDKYSVELFVGEGEQAASAVLYTPLTADGISFEADKPLKLDVQLYKLAVE